MNALIAGVFPWVARHSTAAPFAFFSAMMAITMRNAVQPATILIIAHLTT
jgi:hypothetical protein